ncbi:MAG: phosphotransferase [Pseudomonadales bacterium]|nr:phosphotransferase [Pseudomonadales bacterium]
MASHRQAIDVWQNALATTPHHLAPKLVYRDPGNDYAVFEYVEGTPLPSHAGLQPQLLKTLCQAMHRYHQLPLQCAEPAISYAVRCEHYLDLAASYFDNAKLEVFTRRYQALREDSLPHLHFENAALVCCHNDLNRGNILCHNAQENPNSFMFLDWDFASPGIAAMDFASLGVELGVSSKQLATIARLSDIQLAAAYRVYAFFCEIYNEIQHAAISK